MNRNELDEIAWKAPGASVQGTRQRPLHQPSPPTTVGIMLIIDASGSADIEEEK